MHFEEDKVYHIYNRSNETIFYNERNYLFFLSKIKTLICPVADLIAWCLMPNHFHFLIVANENSCELINEKHRSNVQLLSKNIGTLLSSYTKGLNNEVGRRGKLFSHNTKAKCINDVKNNYNYTATCFHYIHQNPLTAKLCNDINKWEYSSFKDYAGSRDGSLVNKELACELINFDKDNFQIQTSAIIDEKKLKMIW
jgi:putative transposase